MARWTESVRVNLFRPEQERTLTQSLAPQQEGSAHLETAATKWAEATLLIFCLLFNLYGFVCREIQTGETEAELHGFVSFPNCSTLPFINMLLRLLHCFICSLIPSFDPWRCCSQKKKKKRVHYEPSYPCLAAFTRSRLIKLWRQLSGFLLETK